MRPLDERYLILTSKDTADLVMYDKKYKEDYIWFESKSFDQFLEFGIETKIVDDKQFFSIDDLLTIDTKITDSLEEQALFRDFLLDAKKVIAENSKDYL